MVVYNGQGMKTYANAKRWTQIFRVFANINRMKIVKILAGSEKLAVGDIAGKLDISLNATSKHLLMLHDLDILECRGKDNHVYYWLSAEMPADARKVVDLFIGG
jgi:DNA-binding transcriptional ArsR family regulator